MPGPEVGTDAYTSLAVSGSDLSVNLINKGIWLFLLHKDANLGKLLHMIVAGQIM